MAGRAREPERLRVIEELDDYEGFRFVILLRGGNRLPFRGLYACNHDGSDSKLIYGTGPNSIDDSVDASGRPMIETVFRYDSGAKAFKALDTQRIGNTCDAVTLQPRYYRTPNARPV